MCFHLLLQLIGLRVDHKLWSTLHVIHRVTFFIRVFLGRPSFAVYPPRPILNLCYLLVDHNLWSTLHAIIVSPRLIFLSTYYW